MNVRVREKKEGREVGSNSLVWNVPYRAGICPPDATTSNVR